MNKAHIRLLAQDLEVNQSRRTECPDCGKKEFSVTRTAEGVLAHCYRASCSFSGAFVPEAGELQAPTKKSLEPKIKPYTGGILALWQDDLDYFSQRFGLNNDTSLNFIKVTEDDEYLLPVYDPSGFIRGYTVRQPVWKGQKPPRRGRNNPDYPKALAYPEGYPFQSWYIPNSCSGTVVLVEDQISAMAVYQAGYIAVAMLGTDINADHIREISLVHPTTLVFALDEDATDVSYKLARRWGLSFGDSRVLPLARDLKEESTETIKELLQ